MASSSGWSSVFTVSVVLSYSVKLHPTIVRDTKVTHTRHFTPRYLDIHTRSHMISNTIFHRVESQLSLWTCNIRRQIKRYFISMISQNDLLIRTWKNAFSFPIAIATRCAVNESRRHLRASNQNRKYVRCTRLVFPLIAGLRNFASHGPLSPPDS